jgi:hypothetical protein
MNFLLLVIEIYLVIGNWDLVLRVILPQFQDRPFEPPLFPWLP